MSEPACSAPCHVTFLGLDVLAAALRGEFRIPDGVRVGVLGNFGPRGSVASVRDQVAAATGAGVDADLIVAADAMGCALPDVRAFGAAAVIAAVPPSSCSFVTGDAGALVGAAAAGFTPIAVPRTLVPGTSSFDVPAASLLAGEVDPDTGATFVLEGHVVTMMDRSANIENGRLIVSKGLIRAILRPGEPTPTEFTQAPVVRTGGTIYPGLIDLHNHFVYNVLPLWIVPKRYTNRSQWPGHAEYRSGVSKPIRQALAAYTYSSAAIIRYVEAKALMGGTSTGQGILTQTKVGRRAARGAMRNVESTGDARLPNAGTMVPDLQNSAERIEAFRRALQNNVAYFYHLSEGVDVAAHRHFENLVANELLSESLVAVHALALNAEDLDLLAAANSKVVWSPFSNLLLYGRTLELTRLKESGVTFSIGCDWSPTGSRNLLQELKVAEFVNQAQGEPFTSFDLVRAVTAGAAQVVGWHEHLGQLRRGSMADILVVAGTNAADPFGHLIQATEADVQLVLVHGVARYGDRDLVRSVHAGPLSRLENVEVADRSKAFHLHSDEPLLNELTFKAAQVRLQEAMADLPGFVKRMDEEGDSLMALGVVPDELTLAADNEFDAGDPLLEYPLDASLLAADPPMAESIALDGTVVLGDDEYMKRVEKQPNVPSGLATHIANHYSS